MLESLEVLNGELSPKFDSLNNTYTVFISNDINKLELEYHLSENALINIYGNDNLVVGENNVYIEIMNEKEETTTYNLLVTKEEAVVTSTYVDNFTPIESPKELPNYVAPLISIICFILILITYIIIFPHKKHKK